MTMTSSDDAPKPPLYFRSDIDAAMIEVRKHLSRLDRLCVQHRYAHDEVEVGDWMTEEVRAAQNNVQMLQLILDEVFSDENERWWILCDHKK